MVYRGGQVRAKEYELEGGRPRLVEQPRPGSIWVLPAEHRGAALARGNTVAHYCQLTVPSGELGSRPLHPTVGHDPLLHQLIERINSLVDRDDVVARLMHESLTETVRLHLSDRYGPRQAVTRRPAATAVSLDERTQAQLAEYLAEGLDSKISLAAMAEMAGMPIARFSKAFADAFHTTPHQYLLDRRITRAKTLLSTSPLMITEIATAVGFSTPSHFATAFKDRVGATPSEYRRQTMR